MNLLAIDPGPKESACLYYDTGTKLPTRWAVVANSSAWMHADVLAIEMVASYGMPVGADVFETCVAIGRLVERFRGPHAYIYRKDVKLHLCGSPRANDANVRQALIDRYGPGKAKAVGLKASPGPLYGMSSHCWAALGVAITASETSSA